MSKRSATELSTIENEGRKFPKASGSSFKRELVSSEMGEFEDAWEDEIESDEDIVDGEAGNDADGMDVDEDVLPAIEESEEDQHPSETQTFIPGTHKLGQDEILEADDSVYIMRHSLKVTWPCLSFDVLRDNLGDERQRLPATAYLATGTQADDSKKNELLVYKMSSLHKTQKDGDSDSEDEDDDDDDGENLDEDPVLEFRSVPHQGGINRIRAQPLPAGLPPTAQPYHAATWSDTGKVHIWDIRPLIESLDVPGYSLDRERTHRPVFTIKSHGRAEGFAMDWAASGTSSLRLLTGDVNAKIYLTTSTPTGFNALSQPFLSHTSSVEDIQWSPAEPTVFASCSADRTIQIWDVRAKGRKSVAGVDNAHDSDVNVISWNKANSYLLLSGGDEGGLKTWDLRNVKKRGTSGPADVPLASFKWHHGAVTSVEWHPTEDSIFAASGEDDQLSIWDLGVEQDDEEMGVNTSGEDVPPQLLFVHQGQQHVKEVHWHPQIPGTVVSTAYDGFNIFKTISV